VRLTVIGNDGSACIHGNRNRPGIPDGIAGRIIFDKFFPSFPPRPGPKRRGMGLFDREEIVESASGTMDFRESQPDGMHVRSKDAGVVPKIDAPVQAPICQLICVST